MYPTNHIHHLDSSILIPQLSHCSLCFRGTKKVDKLVYPGSRHNHCQHSFILMKLQNMIKKFLMRSGKEDFQNLGIDSKSFHMM
jgi:hypothetical protein